ncbi:DUF4296 domain-containing protein [Sinomicrobium kalidii]|uniref:DUF4296 domain-containing protein n=1 Tax=Sinomicrobium kalidii TaxID=2900738 RepID=UPI001E4E2F11|nr:DUF4296 domain-containing protein [Sinomicrobium kalidii]UGU18021.1 DUF4296 domain-containing protein [Sinomicrobium kalidii]
MKLRNILPFVVLLSVLSCKDKTVEKPDNLIRKDRMTDILVDIALMNAIRGVDTDIFNKEEITPEAYIYQKHNIDSLQFAQSNTYYAARPVDYASMYKEVETRLKTMKDEFEKAREEQRKADSIQKAKTVEEKKTQ